MTKVFVGIPCGEFVRARTAAVITDLLMHSGVELGVKWGFAGDVAQNQNMFAHWTLQTGSDFLFLIETDMLFPSDALTRLLAHDVDIVGALYRHREPPHAVMLWNMAEEVPTGLIERPAIPSGLMLIKAEVLREIPCPWFSKTYTAEPNRIISSDRNFCDHARNAGFRIWADCDLSAEVRHTGSMDIPLRLRK